MRCEVVFHGRVQGVGFRMTARNIARQEGLVGWVRNEPDGTVRMVAQGDHDRVGRLLSRLKEQMVSNIRRADVTEHNDKDDLNSFDIRF
jgi:acylphosphatase